MSGRERGHPGRREGGKTISLSSVHRVIKTRSYHWFAYGSIHPLFTKLLKYQTYFYDIVGIPNKKH